MMHNKSTGEPQSVVANRLKIRVSQTRKYRSKGKRVGRQGFAIFTGDSCDGILLTYNKDIILWYFFYERKLLQRAAGFSYCPSSSSLFIHEQRNLAISPIVGETFTIAKMRSISEKLKSSRKRNEKLKK